MNYSDRNIILKREIPKFCHCTTITFPSNTLGIGIRDTDGSKVLLVDLQDNDKDTKILVHDELYNKYNRVRVPHRENEQEYIDCINEKLNPIFVELHERRGGF